MARSLLGVLAGAVVAVVVIMLVEMVSLWLYPLPAGVDASDHAALAAAVRMLPVGAFLLILVAWLLGAATGAVVALRVAMGAARWPGLAVGGLVLAGAAYNLATIPHPTWFVGVAVVGIIAATLLSTRSRTRAARGAP